jgi:4'-phosphopantetheinyl transferase
MAVTTEHALQFKIRRYDLDASSITPRLDGDEVHVWHLALGDLSSDTALFKESLSADELERASRFRFEKHRAQFVLTRGTLRSLLGSYLGVSPREISFQYSKHNKPSLTEAANLRNIHFNVSHTEGMAIFGFTLAGRIGVDIESLRTDFHAEEIAERFFSASERSALREIPPPARYESFFRIWTRKEAYIKALGEGLSHPLHEFDVSFDEAAALLATRPDGAEAERWHLENLAIAPGFIAAAAVETDAAPPGPTLR